mmetsp:Transcript_29404/g.83717  ORF Transcript_29404/g.83717 Transcript_29404/m.83717 type:complete len:205 (+) Transcript_29404:415-1029(+)
MVARWPLMKSERYRTSLPMTSLQRGSFSKMPQRYAICFSAPLMPIAPRMAMTTLLMRGFGEYPLKALDTNPGNWSAKSPRGLVGRVLMKAAPPCVAMEPTCAKRPEVMIGATEPSACIEKASTMALLPARNIWAPRPNSSTTRLRASSAPRQRSRSPWAAWARTRSRTASTTKASCSPAMSTCALASISLTVFFSARIDLSKRE